MSVGVPHTSLTLAGTDIRLFRIWSDIVDYLSLYKQALGIEFSGKDYNVHHIDQNRENNTLANLVLLPTKLHHQYHYYLGVLNTDFHWDICPSNGGNYYLMEQLDKFYKLWEECCRWYDYKNYLLGYMPNVHEIEL